MKVMLVNGSSHLHGTTMTALEEMIKVFHSEEVETEVVQLGGKPIADCLQCNVCQKTGKCVIKDDGVNEFVEKAKTADIFKLSAKLHSCLKSSIKCLTFSLICIFRCQLSVTCP